MLYAIVLYIFTTYMVIIIILSSKNRQSANHRMPVDKELYYYILIPCMNEEKVIHSTIKRLFALNFRGKAVVIDDASSDSTLEKLKALKNQYPQMLLLERNFPEAQQGKGAALNAALKMIKTDMEEHAINPEKVIIGVLDADGALSKNAFKRLSKFFSMEGVAAAQIRVKMKPTFVNTLQIVQDVEFFTINNFTQKARRSTNSVGLSGNGQFFKLAIVEERIGAAPWGNALLEDYEMTLKFICKGLKIGYLDDIYVYQESLSSARAFIRQRSRWVQGGLECARNTPQIIRAKNVSPIQKMSIFYFLSQPFTNLIADVSILLLGFFILKFCLELQYPVLSVLVIPLGVSYFLGDIFSLIYLLDLKKKRETIPPVKYWFFLPLAVSYMYLILFFSIIIAFWRHFTNQNSWLKTKREN